MIEITRELVREKLKIIERWEDSNKKDYGHLLICAGTLGMAGAAIMCGSGALKSGCGLLTFYAEKNIIPILQTTVPQAMCIDIEKNLAMEKYDAVTFGPGLVNAISARRLRLKRFITEFDVPLIMDAEALKMTAENNDFELLKKRNGNTVLTPHEGEMAKLLGIEYNEVKENRADAATQLQKISGSVVVLKGSKTLVTSGNGSMHVNTSGNPGMATGGSGDILTGMIASLAAQGMSVSDAAVCGVYLHGRAGDIAAQKKGMISMNAMDIIEEIPAAFCETV